MLKPSFFILTLLFSWLERRRQRRLLAGMSRYMLNDIGLTPDEARTNVDRRFGR